EWERLRSARSKTTVLACEFPSRPRRPNFRAILGEVEGQRLSVARDLRNRRFLVSDDEVPFRLCAGKIELHHQGNPDFREFHLAAPCGVFGNGFRSATC